VALNNRRSKATCSSEIRDAPPPFVWFGSEVSISFGPTLPRIRPWPVLWQTGSDSMQAGLESFNLRDLFSSQSSS
jgi:hypothetical protein